MRILGTGSALPALTVDNDRLAEFLDTSDEWIRTRTGIGSRQVLSTETLLDLAEAASLAAFENAGLCAEDVDYVLVSTVLADTITPSLACVLQGKLGVRGPAFDLNGACAGFVYALDVADALLSTGRARKVLLVCAEAMSRLVDWTDRSTCVLFGDGAGAVVLEAGDDLLSVHLTSEGNPVPLNMRAGFGNSPFALGVPAASSLYMDGPEIYKFAVARSIEDLRCVAQKANLSVDRIDHFLLHQANKRIVEAARARLKQPAEKFPTNIAARGNTSSASIPILLDEQNRAGRFRAGDILAFSAFGAGLTTGAAIVRWSKDGSGI